MIAIGSSSFTPYSFQVNSGAVFLFQMAPVAPSSIALLAKGGSGSPVGSSPPPPSPVVPRVTFHHLVTLFHPDKDSSSSSSTSVVNTYFGKEIYFTGEMAFISAFTASFSGIVYYYEKNVITANYEMKQSFAPSQSPFQPNYMNYFGSSVVVYSKKIQLGVPSVRKIMKEVEGSVQSTEATEMKMMKSLQEWFPTPTEELGEFSSSYYSTNILVGGEGGSEEPSNQGETAEDGSPVEGSASTEEDKYQDADKEQPCDNNSNQEGSVDDVSTVETDRSGDEQPEENSPAVTTDDISPVVSFLKIMNEDDDAASKDISNSNNDPVMVVPENDRKESSQTLSLLFVNSPGSSLTPYSSSSSSSSSSASNGNGVVYVYSNHHSLLRNISCGLVGMELAWEETIDSILLSLSSSSSSSSSLKNTLWTPTEIKQFLVYYQQLCTNYSRSTASSSSSSMNEWTLVHQFTLNPTIINSKNNNNNQQLFNPQFGQQLLISTENNNHNGSDSSLFTSAPGLSMNYFDPIAKKINSISSGAVYEDSAIFSTLVEELTNQMTMILNDFAIHKETTAPPPTDTSTDNNNNKNHPNEFIAWISSKNGIIITATCFPMLLLIGIIGYLFSKNSVSYYSSSNGDFSKSVPTESPTKDRQKRKWAQYSYFVSGLPTSSQNRSSPLVRKIESSKEETSTHSMVEMTSKMIQLEEGKANEKETTDQTNEEKEEEADPSHNNNGSFSGWKEWMGSIKRTVSSSAAVSYETISNSLIATNSEKADSVVEPELSYDFYLKKKSDSEAASTTKSLGEEKKDSGDNGKEEEKIDWIQNPLKVKQNKMTKKNLIEEKPVEAKEVEVSSSFSVPPPPPPSAPAGESSTDNTGNQFYRVNIPGILSAVLPSSVILPTSVLPVESSSSVVTAVAPAVHMEEIRSSLPREEEQQPVAVNSRPLSFGSSSLYQQWMNNISRSFSKSTSYTNLNNLSAIVNEQPSSPMEREMQVMNRDKEVEEEGGGGADGKGGYYV
jgi:hypothetical protein